MAKLSDLIVIPEETRDTINLHGTTPDGDETVIELPVAFTMESFEFIQEAYGTSYAQFEKDLNKTLNQKVVRMNKETIKLTKSLVYAMVRAGGTETTPAQLFSTIQFRDVQPAFKKVLEIFMQQNFQSEDVEKIKEQKK